MAKYFTNTEALTSIANAIRTKSGTSESLTYPVGFVTAIGNIQTGGSSAESADGLYFGNPITLPTFTLNNNTYYFEEGQNFSTWCNSAYNTDGYIYSTTYGAVNLNNKIVRQLIDGSWKNVMTSQYSGAAYYVIEENGEYET